jgi:predicted nucleotide-binding protein
MTAHEELFHFADSLSSSASDIERNEISQPISALRKAVAEVSRSFSGSWAGYHSRVYYENFVTPPPGAHFSQEWGLMETLANLGSRGRWREYQIDDVKSHILALAGKPDLAVAETAARSADEFFGRAKAEIASIFQTELEGRDDAFIQSQFDQLHALETLSPSQVLETLHQRRSIMTRDTVVLGQGTQVPPHIAVKARYRSIEHSFAICKSAGEIARKGASHLERRSRSRRQESRIGTNVFIGHGRSGAWRELKDFVQDRVRLPWDEFNRVPVAGVTNIARLAEMMDVAAIAFLVMTAEDEMADGTSQARMNVIHEAGLFQGRLGFSRAIVVLEDGCAEFSNVAGLGQIRFPRGSISASFEEVRRVLEREGLIASS